MVGGSPETDPRRSRAAWPAGTPLFPRSGTHEGAVGRFGSFRVNTNWPESTFVVKMGEITSQICKPPLPQNTDGDQPHHKCLSRPKSVSFAVGACLRGSCLPPPAPGGLSKSPPPQRPAMARGRKMGFRAGPETRSEPTPLFQNFFLKYIATLLGGGSPAFEIHWDRGRCEQIQIELPMKKDLK